MTTRKHDLRTDNRGLIRKRIGYITHTKKQPRFNFGKDRDVAEFRYAILRQLYQENERLIARRSRTLGYQLPKGWWPQILEHAHEIASGKPEVELPCIPPEEPADYVQRFRQYKADFPSLRVVPFDESFYIEGIRILEGHESKYIDSLYGNMKTEGVVETDKEIPSHIIPGTFHEALDAYIEHIEQDGAKVTTEKLVNSQRKRIRHVKNLKRDEDCSLTNLDADRVQKLIAFWKNRPPTERVNRISRRYAKHHLDELVRFFKWLDFSDRFDWYLPRGFDRISRKIVTIKSDHEHATLVEKDVYTPDQLALLYERANNLDRFLLLVGLNCAFGAAEIGRLTEDEVLLDHDHKYKIRLDFESTTEDSFIRVMRPKTKVFGEWLIWKETADIIRWGIERSRQEGGAFIACRRGGNPLYNEASSNPQAAIATRWTNLIEKVQIDHEDFPHKPYGVLRDTIPDKLRHQNNTELASMCVAHGVPFKGDSIIECYGNKPYGRLHDSLRGLREYFNPIFQTVAVD